MKSILGEQTMKRFPHLRPRCEEVLASGMFEVQDLSWIAPCLDMSVRCTIETGTHQQIKDTHDHDAEKDALFGMWTQEVGCHLLFSWQDGEEGSTRKVGHFDLLCPRSKSLFTLHLIPDATQLL